MAEGKWLDVEARLEPDNLFALGLSRFDFGQSLFELFVLLGKVLLLLFAGHEEYGRQVRVLLSKLLFLTLAQTGDVIHDADFLPIFLIPLVLLQLLM